MSVCLSISATFSRYVSVVVEKLDKPEDNIKLAMDIIIENFQKSAGAPPVHLIILRDGVTPSKAKEVADIEIAELKKVVDAIVITNEKWKGKNSLTYIMLNKKNGLRIFNFDKTTKNYDGCKPGTIVDEVIANPDGFKEFFMISQLSRQGTPAATHYHVMHDSRKCNKRDIQGLMYKLCHLYYNWTGGIKVPAPCQFSRRLAYMVGEKLTENANLYLPDKKLGTEIKSLYFL